jgi:hypothetical protein
MWIDHDPPMSLELELVWYVVVLGGIVAISWFGSGSVGLSLAYFISLGFLHFWGGLIHALSWYHGGEADYTRTGFDQFTWAVTGFAIGRCLTAPMLAKAIPEPKPGLAVAKISRMLLAAGVVLYGFLRIGLSNVPSFGALASCGGGLFITGLCLYAWEGINQRKPLHIVITIGSLIFLPFFTIISAGFLGYGAAAALVVVAFLCCQLRSRTVALLFLVVSVYFGFCTFMTYMRDRSDIREEIWEEDSSLTQRFDRLKTTFTRFELVDLKDQDQLDRIESRLNQNDLVGRAVSTLDSGVVDYAEGETFRWAAMSIVPRIIWRSKPITAGSPDIVSYFTGLYFESGTSVGIGQVMEGYINFGTAGVVGLFLVFGTVLGAIDIEAAKRLKARDTLGFVTWFVPGIGLLQPGGSLIEVTGTVAASIVLIIMMKILLGIYTKDLPEEGSPAIGAAVWAKRES